MQGWYSESSPPKQRIGTHHSQRHGGWVDQMEIVTPRPRRAPGTMLSYITFHCRCTRKRTVASVKAMAAMGYTKMTSHQEQTEVGIAKIGPLTWPNSPKVWTVYNYSIYDFCIDGHHIRQYHLLHRYQGCFRIYPQPVKEILCLCT